MGTVLARKSWTCGEKIRVRIEGRDRFPDFRSFPCDCELIYLFGERGEEGSVEEAGSDGDAADARVSHVAGGGKGHADNSTLEKERVLEDKYFQTLNFLPYRPCHQL